MPCNLLSKPIQYMCTYKCLLPARDLTQFHNQRAALEQKVANSYAFQNKVTSQTTMMCVQFVTGILLDISAKQKLVVFLSNYFLLNKISSMKWVHIVSYVSHHAQYGVNLFRSPVCQV